MSLDNPGSKKEHKVKRMLEAGIGELADKQNARLDEIEKFVTKTLTQQGERSRAIQGFIVNEVQVKISNQLWNMNVTIDAFLEVMKEAGLPIENFEQKLDAKKLEIQARRQKEAEEKQKERMQQEAKAQNSATPEEPKQEAPEPQPQETQPTA